MLKACQRKAAKEYLHINLLKGRFFDVCNLELRARGARVLSF